MKKVEGYKILKPDWTGYGDYKYKVGENFEEDITPKCCERGFHFCKELKECCYYHDFRLNCRVVKVEALGDIDQNGNQYCTNKIKIVEEIPHEKVLRLLNAGENNEGIFNTGSGNKGDFNKGSRNIGSCNEGSYNVGIDNIGDFNVGSDNIGDFNFTNDSIGCFNTKSGQHFCFFNKPSNWTYSKWKISRAYMILKEIKPTKWIPTRKMTEEEKKAHPEYMATGGFLKEHDKNDKERQKWWDNLNEADKKAIKDIPNFDADIFYECMDIKVN